MNIEKRKRLTSDLAKAMIDVQNSETRLKVIASDLEVGGKLKRSFNEWARMMGRIKMEFNSFFPESDRQVIRDHIFDDNTTLQLEAIQSYLLALPIEKRDEIEEMCRSFVENINN